MRVLRRSPPWEDVTYWALDLETSGVEARQDCILSVGMVPVRAGAVRWGERLYTLVRSPHCPGEPAVQSMAVHNILPEHLEGAPTLADVVPEISRRLHEGVLLVHWAPFDVAFLRRAFRTVRRRWPRPPVIDTNRLLGRLEARLARLEPYPAAVPRGLGHAREYLGLPPHVSHHALADAVATAELFLALRHRLDARTLRDLI